MTTPPTINTGLVRALIDSQFPKWRAEPIRPVAHSGVDNRTFYLGADMLVRLPSQAGYAPQVAREQRWLPWLAPQLPLPIPTPLAEGTPGQGYPFRWSVYRYLPGTSMAPDGQVPDGVPEALAGFLLELQALPAAGGPEPGPQNYHRGGQLSVYRTQSEEALVRLNSRQDLDWAHERLLAALAAAPPVGAAQARWLHGDIAPGNLLLNEGKLAAVIDFGLMAVGDPACDYAIAWTNFNATQRAAFRRALGADDDSWLRAQGWALWKALILVAGLANGTDGVRRQAERTLEALKSEQQSAR